MKKFTNIGLSAMVAFTMMFATTVVVAKEKVKVSDGIEVTESIEAMMLAGTLEKLNTEISEKKASVLQADERWFPVTIMGGSESNPANQHISDTPSSTTPSGDCSPLNSGEICNVLLDLSTGDPAQISALLSQIANPSQPNPTIKDFRDAGASYTGPGVEPTPEYARSDD